MSDELLPNLLLGMVVILQVGMMYEMMRLRAHYERKDR